MESRYQAAVAALPADVQQTTERWIAHLVDSYGIDSLPADEIARIAKCVACSEFAGNVLLREWPWFLESVNLFDAPPDSGELPQFVRDFVAAEYSIEEQKRRLRLKRNRFLLRVLWREVHGLADLDETLKQLSRLADHLLDAAMQGAVQQLAPRFGIVKSATDKDVPLVVLGMGKLGGRELNFSSDIDLIFCYPEDGESDGAKKLSAHEYFTRLARRIIALLDEKTADGFVFRVDTRLRPFGDSGPHVVSFAALESYLLQHGRDWERYAYVKARIVGTKPDTSVQEELYANLIHPFVYRRYLDYGVFESLRDMQEKIAVEVQRRELRDNVKLGPGGIREAEFVVQALQLVRGGSEPGLQIRELQTVLPRLVSNRGLAKDGADKLLMAYRFLRRLENFIQAIADRQTHDLPVLALDRARLALAMGFVDWDELIRALDQHRAAVSEQFAAVAFRGTTTPSESKDDFGRLWNSEATCAEWEVAFAAPFSDAAKAMSQAIQKFSRSRALQQADSKAQERLQYFVPELIERIAECERPINALRRVLAIVEQILRRSAYLALLNENEQALARLINLCERSQTIADQIARHPVLLDELLDPRTYPLDVTKADLVSELKGRLAGAENADSEEQMQIVAQFQRATLFRIAVADFGGTLPIMKVSDGLTWLAEAVLDESLRVAWADLAARHGVPQFEQDGDIQDAGFGVVGYGKLGGLELSYSSDLDIVFLHNSTGERQLTNGEKPLDNVMFFARLVRRLVHFLTTQTGSGALYEIDTRLRPDGKSGLLVTSTEAFLRYQEENAWTWEHQALLRARAVAGSESVATEFERIRRETLAKICDHKKLRADVISMRRRMRKELDRSTPALFDMKHGRGGLGDIEFLVQYLVLLRAAENPRVIRYSDNIRQLDALLAAGYLDASDSGSLQETYRSYRLHLHHLALDGRRGLVADTEFQVERQAVAEYWDTWLG